MESRIRTRRVYSLAPYNTFEAEVETTAIPEDLMYNTDYIKKVKFLQLLEIELQYYKYIQLVKELDNVPSEEKMKYLRDLKENVSNELNEYLFGTK